jgi:drug/metabolite transporter (DMT)-like permease
VAIPAEPALTRRRAISPGIRAMAVGAFWFSVMGLLVKIAGRRLGSMEIVLFRGVITLALSWWALDRLGISPWGTQRRLLIVRGTLGSIALTCFFYSILHLPLGEATLIQNMNPVFATVLAAVILKEHLRAPEVICLVTSLVGVVFIAQPTALFGAVATPTSLTDVGIALMGALASGTAYTLVRKMRTTEHPLVVVFYLPLLSVPISLPFALADWRWPNATEWLLLVGVGITTQLAQVSMTRGLQLERTARATTVGYLQVAFAVTWGAIVLGEIPDFWTLAGATTIIGSTLVLSWWNSNAVNAETT